MTDTHHGREHILIVHLPSPCPLNRDDLPESSRRLIVEPHPVRDSAYPCVRPITILAYLACHDAPLSCEQSPASGGAIAFQTRPCRGAINPAEENNVQSSAE